MLKLLRVTEVKSWVDNEMPGTEFTEDSEELSWMSIAIFKHWASAEKAFISSTNIYCLPCVWHTSVVNKNIQSSCCHRIHILLGEKISKWTNKIICLVMIRAMKKKKEVYYIMMYKLREVIK